jgi:hypothetical protein
VRYCIPVGLKNHNFHERKKARFVMVVRSSNGTELYRKSYRIRLIQRPSFRMDCKVNHKIRHNPIHNLSNAFRLLYFKMLKSIFCHLINQSHTLHPLTHCRCYQFHQSILRHFHQEPAVGVRVRGLPLVLLPRHHFRHLHYL